MRQNVSIKMKWMRRLWLPILLAGIAGCGNTATVTGKVTYQGRAVTYGSVIFLCDKNVARFAVIQPDGSYTVEAVTAGKAKIGVISRDPAKARSARPDKKPAGSQTATVAGWFAIPRNFENPDDSGIVCTVAAGRMTYDIGLK